MRKLKGDCLKINIMHPEGPKTKGKPTFPWIRFTIHEYGIKNPGREIEETVEAKKKKSREEVAREIGEVIINNSKVLKV